VARGPRLGDTGRGGGPAGGRRLPDHHAQADGREHGGHGEYTEIRPAERLVYRWSWDGDEDAPGGTSLVEVEFKERGGVTTVVLTHSGLSSEESKEGHTEGWQECLDNLERKVLQERSER
jgi:uncharacterized protein YndB with AHSA1/START domain